MNEALAQLYQQTILDHVASPRRYGPLPDATHEAQLNNPLCGDRVLLRLRLDGENLAELAFEGEGCAISIAAASLLCALLGGRTREEARALDAEFRKLLSDDHAATNRAALGELVALEGTRLFPSRISCATLPWDALSRALR